MSLSKIKFTVLVVVIIIIGAVFLLKLLGIICPIDLIASSVDKPVIIVRDSDLLCTGISQIISDDNHIYVLYGRHSVVQVYTLDGNYLYSVSLH